MSQNNKKAKGKTFRFFVVEVTGLEPTTSWSLTKRATKLRYTSLFAFPIYFGRSTTSWPSSLLSADFSRRAFGAARVRSRQLLSPKISHASLAAIFEGPDHSALPNCATPRSKYVLSRLQNSIIYYT